MAGKLAVAGTVAAAGTVAYAALSALGERPGEGVIGTIRCTYDVLGMLGVLHRLLILSGSG